MELGDKAVAAIIGSISTALTGAALFLFKAGGEKEKFTALQKDVAEVKADVKTLQKETLPRTEFEDTILEINRRMDRHMGETAKALESNRELLYTIGKDVAFIKGRTKSGEGE